MEFILPGNIFMSLLAVIAIIILDTLFGIIFAIKAGEFDLSKLPQFLAKNIFPYCGGLLLLALAAEYLGGIWRDYIFYLLCVPVAAKFVKELWEKIKGVLGVDIDVDIEIKPPAAKQLE